MERKRLTSSQIRSVGYDPSSQTLGSLCIACADRVAVGIDRWQGARCSRYRDIDKPSNAASDRSST